MNSPSEMADDVLASAPNLKPNEINEQTALGISQHRTHTVDARNRRTPGETTWARGHCQYQRIY